MEKHSGHLDKNKSPFPGLWLSCIKNITWLLSALSFRVKICVSGYKVVSDVYLKSLLTLLQPPSKLCANSNSVAD